MVVVLRETIVIRTCDQYKTCLFPNFTINNHIWSRLLRTPVIVMSNWIFENIFVITHPKTAATPELHLASRGFALAPRPSHTAALLCPRRITGAVPNSASGVRGEAPSRGRICSLPGVAENRKNMVIPVSQNSVCINASKSPSSPSSSSSSSSLSS